MKFLDEYRNPSLVKALVARIRRRAVTGLRIMEFCGSHTVAIMKHGLRQLLSSQVALVSGPGCPVCVTAPAEIDQALSLAKHPGIIVATFGDLLKVPGSATSLQQARAEGADVRIVYSALDALELAEHNPEKAVALLGIGFETTAPTTAASIQEAARRGIENYYLLSLHKRCPPVMDALLASGETTLDGIICPGHVSAVIGSRPYAFIPSDYGIGCVIAGFEPLDILLAVDMLLAQRERSHPEVEIAYRRGVKPEGNPKALAIMETVFEASAAEWRGMGLIAQSGLSLRDAYRRFDAEHAFAIERRPAAEPQGCLCGAILRGVKEPSDCSFFGRSCTPVKPVGPCMVSSEGACAAYYRYGAADGR